MILWFCSDHYTLDVGFISGGFHWILSCVQDLNLNTDFPAVKAVNIRDHQPSFGQGCIRSPICLPSEPKRSLENGSKKNDHETRFFFCNTTFPCHRMSSQFQRVFCIPLLIVGQDRRLVGELQDQRKSQRHPWTRVPD